MFMTGRKNNGGVKNRSRLDIIASILGVADGGAKKTYVMHQANLSYGQLERYTDFLVKVSCLEINVGEKGEIYFKRTLKGDDYLGLYSALRALMEHEGYPENKTSIQRNKIDGKRVFNVKYNHF
jgi:predicted transcriptional regulator